ncbi:hypothetical protein [Haloarchaeobius sp. DFWS5]|uniref:DUF7857 domain-containing protein n=1 Tax=Haloarchaeobius sp. DFWS5 TaxID=3446114 RepID=UPI003EB768DE
MVELDVRTERRDCVTFVAATLTNDGTRPRRVTLESGLDPVWPPRRQGVPEAGWDGVQVTVTVPAMGSRGVGFASPEAVSDSEDSVVGVVDETPLSAATDDTPATTDYTAEGLVRTLGDPTPPGDVVPSSGATAVQRPKPPRAVTAWLDGLSNCETVTDRDRANVRLVADRTAALSAALEER